ncbi:MAG TPA: hypothetical protein VHB77_15990, partial [Planctomycetaceae bacterium]|nr:hypothetical protein [Planctomycetaceae bacterium]
MDRLARNGLIREHQLRPKQVRLLLEENAARIAAHAGVLSSKEHPLSGHGLRDFRNVVRGERAIVLHRDCSIPKFHLPNHVP